MHPRARRRQGRAFKQLGSAVFLGLLEVGVGSDAVDDYFGSIVVLEFDVSV